MLLALAVVVTALVIQKTGATCVQSRLDYGGSLLLGFGDGAYPQNEDVPLHICRGSLFEAAPGHGERLLQRPLLVAKADLNRKLSRTRPCHQRTRVFVGANSKSFGGANILYQASDRTQKPTNCSDGGFKDTFGHGAGTTITQDLAC